MTVAALLGHLAAIRQNLGQCDDLDGGGARRHRRLSARVVRDAADHRRRKAEIPAQRRFGRARNGLSVQLDAAQRSGLELLGEQLYDGQPTAGLRYPLLEQPQDRNNASAYARQFSLSNSGVRTRSKRCRTSSSSNALRSPGIRLPTTSATCALLAGPAIRQAPSSCRVSSVSRRCSRASEILPNKVGQCLADPVLVLRYDGRAGDRQPERMGEKAPPLHTSLPSRRRPPPRQTPAPSAARDVSVGSGAAQKQYQHRPEQRCRHPAHRTQAGSVQLFERPSARR